MKIKCCPKCEESMKKDCFTDDLNKEHWFWYCDCGYTEKYPSQLWSSAEIGKLLICDATKKPCLCKHPYCDKDCDIRPGVPMV